ncbi:MAG: hypothetical protein NC393_14730 [Clostridium sp.]|nr:hypothetical protein [Clostridium sp.]MCM1173368.1 hypothetical protein [Clostridium sp.]MCM1207438.1 hypothetical protein [Ruminococcus sp.]
MELGMIDGMIINPVKLKEQCALITQNYDYQNASYILLSNRINMLCEEDGLKGNAIAGFQLQMSNYKAVFDALCYANELDKYDSNTLIAVLDSELGSDILDGTEILEKIRQAEADYDRYLSQRRYWYSEYMNAQNYEIIYIDLCYYTYKHYENLADDAVEDKAYWERRGELLLSISEKLSGLFANGNTFRDCANKGINQITTSFNIITNTYIVGDMSWKDELLSFIGDSVYKESGEIDWELIKQILSKDADFISDTEYMLAAYAYMNANEDEMNEFFIMCRVPEYVDQAEWITLSSRHRIDDITFRDKCMLTLDSAKIDGVCRQANVYQTNLLAMLRYGELDKTSKDTLTNERDKIIQKITMAHTLDEIHSFYGSWDKSDCFNFKYCDVDFGPAADLKVTYNSLMYGTDASLAALESHTVTVSNTLRREAFNIFLDETLKNYALKELTSYSTSIVGENIGTEVASTALGSVPGGGFAVFGMGLVKDIYENERNYAFINDAFENLEIGDIAYIFDCCGQIVLYDDNKVSVSIYEYIDTGKNTKKIGNLIGNTNLNSKYLLEHPMEVFQECHDYLKEHDDKEFYEIIQGN